MSSAKNGPGQKHCLMSMSTSTHVATEPISHRVWLVCSRPLGCPKYRIVTVLYSNNRVVGAISLCRIIVGFTVVCQGEFIHRITEVTKKFLSSSDQKRLENPVSPAYHAIAPPSPPGRAGSSTTIDGHFESSLTEMRACTGKDPNKARQSTYISYTAPCTNC